MKQLRIRTAGPQDRDRMLKWLQETPGNLFDKAILEYPTLSALVSYDEYGNPVAYLPIQAVAMLESLGVNPEVGELDKAQSFRDLIKGAMLSAYSAGIREVYFLCSDEQVINMALHQGFEKVPYPVLRMKL